MANLLQELALSAYGFQLIQEVPIEATAEKTWAAVLNLEGWFGINPDPKISQKHTLEARVGGKWMSQSADGTAMMHAEVTLIEPKKLLRLSGPFGMSHLPVTTVVIFDLRPSEDGKSTMLRVGQRSFGYMDPGAKEKYMGGWGKFLPLLKGARGKAVVKGLR